MDDVIGAPTRYKLDVVAYHRMAGAGIFGQDERVELIEGDLIDMAPIGQGHAGNVTSLAEAFFIAAAGRAIVSVQCPIRLDHHSEPQPDLAILRRRADFYATGTRPGPADTLLVVEVADTSLHYDTTVKLPLYARSGIAEYWIIDLKQRVLLAHRSPEADRYTAITTHTAGEQLALTLAPDIVVSLNLMFG